MLYDFLYRNPSLVNHTTYLEIDEVSDDLYFTFGFRLPYYVKNFYATQNGLITSYFNIYTLNDLKEKTELNGWINSPGTSKSLCLGEFNSGCYLYDYNEKLIQNYDYYHGVLGEYVDVFSLFNDLYELYGLKNIMEDKTQGEIHKTNIESIDFSGVEFVVD